MKPRYGIPKFASASLANGSKRDTCVDIFNSYLLAVAYGTAIRHEFEKTAGPLGYSSCIFNS
jgi:hypothetical protein